MIITCLTFKCTIFSNYQIAIGSICECRRFSLRHFRTLSLSIWIWHALNMELHGWNCWCMSCFTRSISSHFKLATIYKHHTLAFKTSLHTLPIHYSTNEIHIKNESPFQQIVFENVNFLHQIDKTKYEKYTEERQKKSTYTNVVWHFVHGTFANEWLVKRNDNFCIPSIRFFSFNSAGFFCVVPFDNGDEISNTCGKNR